MVSVLAYSISALCVVSLALNAFLTFKFKQRKARPEAYEVGELLQDLLAGQALVKVQRVAPTDVFVRSPRGDQ